MVSRETESVSHRVHVEEAERPEAEPLINVPSLSLASAITTVAIVVMTILSEESSSFEDWLADFAGHHWVGKGLIAFGIFIVSWLAMAVPLARYGEDTRVVRRSVLAAAGSALAAIVIIFLYFVGHFVGE
jgi:hypothetical protein